MFASCAQCNQCVIPCAQYIIHVSTESSTTSFVDTVVSRCPKCATNKKGQPNCCVRGGAWFGKCGREGDANFDHTWDEGLSVCKRGIANGMSEAEAKKFEELQIVGSNEQNITRSISPVSTVGVLFGSVVERRASGQFNTRLAEIVLIVSMVSSIILSR